MKTIILSTILSFCAGTAAFANVSNSHEETLSRALQQARRVATMENDQDLPSRAVWLGQRVAKNSVKLAVKSQPKLKKKNPTSVQN